MDTLLMQAPEHQALETNHNIKELIEPNNISKNGREDIHSGRNTQLSQLQIIILDETLDSLCIVYIGGLTS